MKRSYSYFIVKPDGIRYLDEILEDLEGKFQGNAVCKKAAPNQAA